MIKPPFPYFGGKQQVANVVWNALEGNTTCQSHGQFTSGPHAADTETRGETKTGTKNGFGSLHIAENILTLHIRFWCDLAGIKIIEEKEKWNEEHDHQIKKKHYANATDSKKKSKKR